MIQQNIEHVWSSKDEWMQIMVKSERKKRQNRVNQRARRSRKEQNCLKPDEAQAPYRVGRWRVSSFSSSQLVLKTEAESPTPDDKLKKNVEFCQRYIESVETVLCPASPTIQTSVANLILFPLSPDHVLLHLIHYNVFRAMTSNKAILTTNCSLKKEEVLGACPGDAQFRDFCEGLTTIAMRKHGSLPHGLQPTTIQAKKPHASWLNVFPHARFRNNLIEMEGIYDAGDLCQDLMGELFRDYRAAPTTNLDHGASSCRDTDDVAANRNGLIVWSNPWEATSWEITPGFLTKWSWLLKGCEDFIESSNRLRAERGEAPLRLTIALGVRSTNG